MQQTDRVSVQKADKTLYGPGENELQVLGKHTTTLTGIHTATVQDLYVIRGLAKPLLGRPAIESLKLVEVVGEVRSSQPNYQEKYRSLFTGLGKFEQAYDIKLKDNAKPYVLTVPRRIAFPLMDKVKSELNRMQELGVISPVQEPTEWCSGLVVVPKKNGKVRLCVDLTQLNEATYSLFHKTVHNSMKC